MGKKKKEKWLYLLPEEERTVRGRDHRVEIFSSSLLITC